MTWVSDLRSQAAQRQAEDGTSYQRAVMRLLVKDIEAREPPLVIARELALARRHWWGEALDEELLAGKVRLWELAKAPPPDVSVRLVRAALCVVDPDESDDPDDTIDWYVDLMGTPALR